MGLGRLLQYHGPMFSTQLSHAGDIPQNDAGMYSGVSFLQHSSDSISWGRRVSGLLTGFVPGGRCWLGVPKMQTSQTHAEVTKVSFAFNFRVHKSLMRSALILSGFMDVPPRFLAAIRNVLDL